MVGTSFVPLTFAPTHSFRAVAIGGDLPCVLHRLFVRTHCSWRFEACPRGRPSRAERLHMIAGFMRNQAE